MISIQQIQKNQYSNFKDPNRINSNFIDSRYKGSYQKAFKDDIGIKYFINIHHYIFDNSLGESFESDVQFKNDNGIFNITLLSEKKRTLDEIESFFNQFWVDNNCNYCEYF